jgi:hypothetical protein
MVDSATFTGRPLPSRSAGAGAPWAGKVPEVTAWF